MPKQTTTVTTTTEVTIAPKVRRQLLTELQGYAALATEIKVLTAGKNDHSAEVLRIATEHVDGDKFEIEGHKVAVVRGAKDKRLDKQALLKRLVGDGKYSLKAAMALLEDCSPEKSKKDHVRITIPGEEKSGDD